VRDSLILGADFYETLDEIRATDGRGIPPVGIGEDSLIERAIIDKNARIGRGVQIRAEGRDQELDGDDFFIREGIVIVGKGAVIPDGTVI
jgi:glucose-1-phosphate adenylyltransferase